MNDIFSFIIISFNRVHDTIDAVKNVLELDDVVGWSKEILVLNNGSSSDYSEFKNYIDKLPSEENKKIRYLDHSVNLGVAGGRNHCIREARGKYLLFMDDDSELMNKDVISMVLGLYEKYKNQNLGIIGFLGKNPYTGKTETPIKNRALLIGKQEIFYNLFFGYGHVFPKSLIEKTGFYQDDFFYGMEEYDLSYATVKAGYSILFSQDILVLHKQNPDGREPSNTTYARMFENKMIVVYKHLPMIYIFTHFLLWSCFFLYKSKLSIRMYVRSLSSLGKRIKEAKREVMNKNGMDYLRKVGARITY